MIHNVRNDSCDLFIFRSRNDRGMSILFKLFIYRFLDVETIQVIPAIYSDYLFRLIYLSLDLERISVIGRVYSRNLFTFRFIIDTDGSSRSFS